MSPPSADQLLVLLRSHETAWRLRVSGDLLHLLTPLRQDAQPIQQLRPAPAPRRR